jgi:hypothetical protein
MLVAVANYVLTALQAKPPVPALTGYRWSGLFAQALAFLVVAESLGSPRKK